MAKYRKIDPRIWNDEKFRELSHMGKLVFMFLMTHPHMTALGAMRASIPGLAAEIKMDGKAFGKAFGEAFLKGMIEHDTEASFIALPNFLKYNGPESPNVVKAWASSLDLIPECNLKAKLIQRVKGFAEALPEAFLEALPEAFAKSMPYQEQEQEQEKKGEGAAPAPDEPILKLGEFGWARITEQQRAKLLSRLNGSLEAYIQRFDRWVNEAPDAKDRSGVKRRNRHPYESILTWYDRDVQEGKVKKQVLGRMPDKPTPVC